MNILYIFPYPDDESFGPAHATHMQRRQGHEVYLVTLTRGGTTRQRFKYQYSGAQMGEVRYREMLEMARVLNLSGKKWTLARSSASSSRPSNASSPK